LNAINHAATALLIRRKWPGVPLLPILLCVQLVECLWVIFNLLGIEATYTAGEVHAINDIHLAHMPYSHSLASSLLLAGLVWWLIARVFRRPGWGLALALAVLSHIMLDLLTHVPDIALAPGIDSLKFGSGLYGIPIIALAFETLYGVWCWWVFRGSKALLAVILGFNLAALSFYVPQIPGPEMWLAGHPKVFAAIIGLHIVAGWAAIWVFARRQAVGRR